MTGANILYEEWPELVAELVADGRIGATTAAQFPSLAVAGIIGSIDNDMFGSDVTTGADTALHRIVEATDTITSTAASHQRSFVVEVMGRHCGYLALMGALAAGADWVLIPESPPDVDDWAETMCRLLRKGRETGRRDTLVVIAEGHKIATATQLPVNRSNASWKSGWVKIRASPCWGTCSAAVRLSVHLTAI